MIKIKADLHVHTTYSPDSLITLKELIYYARKKGLAAVAVTDHNRIDGALKIAKETDFLIIPGMEVSSRDGHIVALDMQEAVDKGLSADETVDRIYKAGGLAVAVHPFAFLKGSLGKHANGKFDAIETINASAVPFNRNTKKAEEVAARYGKPRVAGTDAHYAPAIGCAYTLIEAEPNANDILKAIAKGQCQPFGKPIPWAMKMIKQYRYFERKIRTRNETENNVQKK